MVSLYLMDTTVSGLAVAVRARIVGCPSLYLTCLVNIYPRPKKEVLKLWLNSERECASSTQAKLISGKS